MRRSWWSAGTAFSACVGILLSFAAVRPVMAHCDTLDGPVVAAARIALARNDVTPVLKWVSRESEAEVRAAFARTAAVRDQGPSVRDLADLWFFETVVRLHRQGEGEPFTGLKPAGTDAGPMVTMSDRAIESGSVDDLVRRVTDAVAAGIRERFARVLQTRKRADESVESGRAFVAAYVEFVHYVERLGEDATPGAPRATGER